MLTGRILHLSMAIIVLSLISLTSANAGAEEIRVGAGAAPTANVFAKILDPMEQSTGLKLVLISNGPVDALKQLDEGTVDAAAGGMTFQDWMSLMEKSGYNIPDKNAYKYRVIGKDCIGPNDLRQQENAANSLTKVVNYT